MKIIFQIEHHYENGYILGRILNSEENLGLEINSELTAFEIKTILPLDALNTAGNPRTDLFIFSLKINPPSEKLSAGTIIELV